MKKFRYIAYYFLFFFCMCILFQRFVLVVHLMPMGGYSWNQIWQNIPSYIIISTILAFCTNYFMNELRRKQIEDAIEAKRRIEERKKYYSSPNTHECRVCGCHSENFPWGEDGKNPSYQICPCCGVQFGKEDCTLESIKSYRAEWIRNGKNWFAKNEKPEGWEVEAQMKNIPDEFR